MRRALIRWLGGRQQGNVAPASAAPALPQPDPQAAALDPSRLLQQAERLFGYAELLSQQGCSDLAGPIYRQACLNLRAHIGITTVPGLAPPPVLAPPAGGSPIAAGPDTAVAKAARPPQDQLAALRQRLNSSTAPEVEQSLLQLLRQGQRDAELSNLLGLALLLQQRGEEAERWLREAITLQPRHQRALVNLAGLCLAGGRAEEAVPLLNRAIEISDPRSSEGLAALTNLCLAHQKLNRPMDAAQLALRIFRIKPDQLRPESLAAAAETLEEMGEEEGAIELLRHLHAHGGGSEPIRRLAQLLERRGDFQEAALVYRDLLSQPDSIIAPA